MYTICLPKGFAPPANAVFADSRRAEWVGPLRADSSQAAIDVWVSQLTADQAAGDPIALGVKLLEDSGRKGAADYARTKTETGMVSGNWVTRFYDTCVVSTPNGNVPIRAVNLVWIDRGRLVIATAYDALPYVKKTMPVLEASIYSIAPAPDDSEPAGPGNIPVGGR
jgi:hypothetical protein